MRLEGGKFTLLCLNSVYPVLGVIASSARHDPREKNIAPLTQVPQTSRLLRTASPYRRHELAQLLRIIRLQDG